MLSFLKGNFLVNSFAPTNPPAPFTLDEDSIFNVNKINELSDKLRTLGDRVTELLIEKEKLEKQLAYKEKENSDLLDKIADLIKYQKTIQAEKDSLNNQKLTLETQITQKKAELNSLASNIMQMEHFAKEEKNRLLKENERLLTKSKEKEIENAKFQEKIAILESEKRRLEKELKQEQSGQSFEKPTGQEISKRKNHPSASTAFPGMNFFTQNAFNLFMAEESLASDDFMNPQTEDIVKVYVPKATSSLI